jgi:hypothetical protein
MPRLLLALVWRSFLLSSALWNLNRASQSFAHLTNTGRTFVPASRVEHLADILNTNDMTKCFQHCNMNVFCRTFVYDSTDRICTLYEGLMETGLVISSSNMTSLTGGLLYTENLFIHYGETCDKCVSNRYLQCSNTSLCVCRGHSFFNGSICDNQLYHAHCYSLEDSCRADLGLHCVIGVCQCDLGTAWNETQCIASENRVSNDKG